MKETKIINTPKSNVFNIEGAVRDAGFNMKLEDDDIGVIVRVQAVKRKVNFQAPIEAPELKSFEFEETGIMYDVDYYTARPIIVGQFKAREWIEQSHRLVRRDSKPFLGGL